MNVAFFGTSDRSIPILEALNNSFSLVLCVTKEDVKVGRKQTVKETAVKKWAMDNRVQIVTGNPKIPNTALNIQNALLGNNVEVGVVADYSYILPEKIINTPQLKLVNIHFSLLPYYRGASPVQAAIKNGDKITGVTYYVMDKEMDTGDTLFQFEYKLKGTETTQDLYSTLFNKAAEKLPEVLNQYEKNILTPKPQNNIEATYTYSLTHPKHTFIYKEDAKINWEKPVQQIEQEIRAYYPWPISWTTLEEINKNSKIATLENNPPKLKKDKNTNLTVKIYSAEITSVNKLKINELQVEGKNKMNWKDFSNGYLTNA
ncbi:MAG: methionyl-tRNA formyltransferase [Patescibacteria group bacterium]